MEKYKRIIDISDIIVFQKDEEELKTLKGKATFIVTENGHINFNIYDDYAGNFEFAIDCLKEIKKIIDTQINLLETKIQEKEEKDSNVIC